MSIKEIKSVTKNVITKKMPGPDNITGEVNQTFKGKNNINSTEMLPKY